MGGLYCFSPGDRSEFSDVIGLADPPWNEISSMTRNEKPTVDKGCADTINKHGKISVKALRSPNVILFEGDELAFEFAGHFCAQARKPSMAAGFQIGPKYAWKRSVLDGKEKTGIYLNRLPLTTIPPRRPEPRKQEKTPNTTVSALPASARL